MTSLLTAGRREVGGDHWEPGLVEAIAGTATVR
jgi:hypothetical protein